ncbi:MAG: hypothetical protein ACRC5A_15765 [Enterobacteriaceae bacterium]
MGDAEAISLKDNATIIIKSGALVQNDSSFTYGNYGSGGNTIDFRDNTTLTIEQGATVYSKGAGSAEAINPMGQGNTITNSGTIISDVTPPIWFEFTTGAGGNTLINNETGVIQAGTLQSPHTVFGMNGNASNYLIVTNKGTMIGDLQFGDGNDTLNLYTTSVISGTVNGGLGTNLLTLNGTGSATLDWSKYTHWQTLTKQESGTWTINSALSGVSTLNINSGVLILNGANTLADSALNFAGGALGIGDASHTSASLAVTGGTFAVGNNNTLGGYGTITADINNQGTLSAGNAFTGMQSSGTGNLTIVGNLTQQGVIQLAGSGAGNTLTLQGNYSAQQNAAIHMQAALVSDNSVTDQLIINGGTVTGTTEITVANAGGAGGKTTGNGINIIHFINGGISQANAFQLKEGYASAGPYAYYLFQGAKPDVSLYGPSTDYDWYLRSILDPADVPTLAPNSPATPTNLSAPVVLYRPEAPLYSAIPMVLKEMIWRLTGTFHERQGEQQVVTASDKVADKWVRGWGMSWKQKGESQQKFDGGIGGFQFGQELYRGHNRHDHSNYYGLMMGYSRADGDVDALSWVFLMLAQGP